MRAVIQRVKEATVRVDGKTVGSIGRGLLVFLGVEKGDGRGDLEYIAKKVVNLRIFEDHKGQMNISLKDVGGEVLLVSQFTLLGDARKGRRPSFERAEEPGRAEELYLALGSMIEREGIRLERGVFRAMMEVELVNDGPVTILLDSRRPF